MQPDPNQQVRSTRSIASPIPRAQQWQGEREKRGNSAARGVWPISGAHLHDPCSGPNCEGGARLPTVRHCHHPSPRPPSGPAATGPSHPANSRGERPRPAPRQTLPRPAVGDSALSEARMAPPTLHSPGAPCPCQREWGWWGGSASRRGLPPAWPKRARGSPIAARGRRRGWR